MSEQNFSIIIPIKNDENNIPRCLDSILNQQLFSTIQKEIIVIDDNSTDNSYNIVLEYSKKYPEIKLFKLGSESNGTPSGRNLGLDNISFENIIFVDSDDYIHEKTFSLLNNILNKHNTDLIIYGSNIVDKDNILSVDSYKFTYNLFNSTLSKQKTVEDDILSKLNSSVCNKLFKKSIIDKYNIRFNENLYFDDMDFIYKYVIHCNQIYFLNRKLYYFTINPNSKINKIRENINNNIEKLSLGCFDSLYSYYEKMNVVNQYKNFLNYFLKKCCHDDTYFLGQDQKENIENYRDKIVKKYNLQDFELY